MLLVSLRTTSTKASTNSVDLIQLNKESLWESCTDSSQKLRNLSILKSITQLEIKDQESPSKTQVMTENVLSTHNSSPKFRMLLLNLCCRRKSSRTGWPNTKKKLKLKLKLKVNSTMNPLIPKSEKKQITWLVKSLTKSLVISMTKHSQVAAIATLRNMARVILMT